MIMINNLYHSPDYKEILNRINKIAPEACPLWGKMSAAQMLAHCSEVMETYTGEKHLKVTFLSKLFRGLIGKTVFGQKPYKKNTPTAPQFKITQNHDFEIEKERLITQIEKFYSMPKENAEAFIHPLFGKTSVEERGWAMYKHLDHHLRQFGV